MIIDVRTGLGVKKVHIQPDRVSENSKQAFRNESASGSASRKGRTARLTPARPVKTEKTRSDREVATHNDESLCRRNATYSTRTESKSESIVKTHPEREKRGMRKRCQFIKSRSKEKKK